VLNGNLEMNENGVLSLIKYEDVFKVIGGDVENMASRNVAGHEH